MSARPAILSTLTQSRNLAVERVIEHALAAAAPEEQKQLATVLLDRNRRSGWVALIRAYDRLDDSVRDQLVSRPRDLFGPLAETIRDSDGPARENVIAIVRRCADAKLIYLLAEALIDSRSAVRELAGRSLLDAVRQFVNRSPDEAVDPAAEAQLRRAMDFALRQFRTHRQQPAIVAALILQRQQDSPIWAFFQDTYDELTRAGTAILRAANDPDLAPALLLALCGPLKPAAAAGLIAGDSPAFASALAAQSFRLLDPRLREATRCMAHLKLLVTAKNKSLWTLATWSQWMRLVDAVGLPGEKRLALLTDMRAAAPPGPEGVAWRLFIVRAAGDSAAADVGPLLAEACADEDERIARVAARYLISRRQPEWRNHQSALARSPHLSVRRIGKQGMRQAPSAKSGGGASPTQRQGFSKVWESYPQLPPVIQATETRAAATDPQFIDNLKAALSSADLSTIAQGLKMLSSVPDLTPYRGNIIVLCGHLDARIAAISVRLVGRLEDPRLKDLLEAAAQHQDKRVRANAIEAMEALHIANRSQQVLAMLNSRHNRERANAIKALSAFNFVTARECLIKMLSDPNPLHRISALWVIGQLQVLEVVRQVSSMARRDPNIRVRKRAADMLETMTTNAPLS